MACLNRNQTHHQEMNQYDSMQENLDEILLSGNAIQANRQMRDILKSRGKQTGGSIEDVRKAIQTQQSHTWFQFPSASDLFKKISSSTLGQNIAKYLRGGAASASSDNLSQSSQREPQQVENSSRRGEEDEDGESSKQRHSNQFGQSQSSSLTQFQQGQRGLTASGSYSQSPQPYSNNFQQSQQPYKQSQQSSTQQQQRIFDNSSNNVIINYNKFTIRNSSQNNSRNAPDIDPFNSDSSTPCASIKTNNNIAKSNNNWNNYSEKQINNSQPNKSNLFSNISANQNGKHNHNNGRLYLEPSNSQSEDSCMSGSEVQSRFQSQAPAYDSSKSNYFQVKYGTTAKNVPQPMKIEQTPKPNIAQRVIVFYSSLKTQKQKRTTTFSSYNSLSVQRPVAMDPYTFRPYVQEKAANNSKGKVIFPGVKRVAKETAQMQVERIVAQQRNLHKANWTVLEQSRKVEQIQKERADRLQAEKSLKQSLLKNVHKKLAGDKRRIFAINEEADHDGDGDVDGGDVYEEQTLKIPNTKNLRPSSEVQTSCSSDDGDFKGLSKAKTTLNNLSKNNNLSSNDGSDNSKLQQLQDVYKQFDQMVVLLSSQFEVVDMLKKLMNSISESKSIPKVQPQTTLDGGVKAEILQRQILSPPSSSFHIDQILNNSANKAQSTPNSNTTAVTPIIPQRSLFKSKDSDEKSGDETKNNLFKSDECQNQNKTNNIFAVDKKQNKNNSVNTAAPAPPVVNIFAPVANNTATPAAVAATPITKEQINIFAATNSETTFGNTLSKGKDASVKSAEDHKEIIKQSPAVIAQNIFGTKEVNAKLRTNKPAEGITTTVETPIVIATKQPEIQNEKQPETKVKAKNNNKNQEGSSNPPIAELPANNQASSSSSSSKESQPTIAAVSDSKKKQQIGQSSIEINESKTQSEISLKKSELGIRRSESSIIDHDPIPDNNNDTISHKMVESVITKTAEEKKEDKDSKSKNIFAPSNANNTVITPAATQTPAITSTATNLFAQPVSNPFSQSISNPFDQKISNPFAQQSNNSNINLQQVSAGVAGPPQTANPQQTQPIATAPSQPPLSLDQLIAQKTNKNLFTQNNAISSTSGDNLFSTSNTNPLANIFGNVNSVINQNQPQSQSQQQPNQINNNTGNPFADNKNIQNVIPSIGSASTQGTLTNIWSQNNGFNNQVGNSINQNQQNSNTNNNNNTANALFSTNTNNTLFNNNNTNNQMANKIVTTGTQASNNIFGVNSNPFGNNNNNQNLQVPFNNTSNNNANTNQLNSSFNQNNVSFSSQNMFVDAQPATQNNTNIWNGNNNNNNASNQNNIWSRQPQQPQTFSNPSTQNNFWSQQQQTQQPANNQRSSNMIENSMGIENNQMGNSQISTNYSNSNNTYNNPPQSYNYNSVSNTVLPNSYYQNSTSSSNTYPQMQQTNFLAQNQGASSLFQSSSSNTNNLNKNKPNNNTNTLQGNSYLPGGQQQNFQQQQQVQSVAQNNLLLFPANDGKKQQPKKNEPSTRASKLIGSNNNAARIK